MEKKTEKKLERKFLALPLHFIDTSVWIESFKETRLQDICLSYLNRVGYNYRGKISLSVLGEYLLIILRNYRTVEEKETSIKILDDILKKRKITFSTPTKTTLEIAIKIMELDSRIAPSDSLHYASAVHENAKTFVTLDEDLIKNITLVNEFGVDIKHPKDL